MSIDKKHVTTVVRESLEWAFPHDDMLVKFTKGETLLIRFNSPYFDSGLGDARDQVLYHLYQYHPHLIGDTKLELQLGPRETLSIEEI